MRYFWTAPRRLVRKVMAKGDYENFEFAPKFHHHHHISVMELGHLLTHSGLTYPEISSKVCHDSFCQLGNSVSLPWVIYYGAFYLHIVSSFSCIPVICLKLVLFLIPLQFVHLFCSLQICGTYVLLCLKQSIFSYQGLRVIKVRKEQSKLTNLDAKI